MKERDTEERARKENREKERQRKETARKAVVFGLREKKSEQGEKEIASHIFENLVNPYRRSDLHSFLLKSTTWAV